MAAWPLLTNVLRSEANSSQDDQQLMDAKTGRHSRAPTILDFEDARVDGARPCPLQPGISGTWPSRTMQLHHRSARRCSLLDRYIDSLDAPLLDPRFVLYSPTAFNTWNQISKFGGSLSERGRTDGQHLWRWCLLTGLALHAWKIYFCLLCVYAATEGVNNLISKRLRARLAWTSTQVLNDKGKLITWPKFSLGDSRMLFASFTMASKDEALGQLDGVANIPFARSRASGTLAPIDLSHLEYGEESLPSSERTCAFMDQ